MKVWVLLLAIIGWAVGANPKGRPSHVPPAMARPPQPSQNPETQENKTVRLHLDIDHDGKFTYGFETDNGIVIQATGELKPIWDDLGQVTNGGNSLKNTEGVPTFVKYVVKQCNCESEGDAAQTPPQISSET